MSEQKSIPEVSVGKQGAFKKIWQKIKEKLWGYFKEARAILFKNVSHAIITIIFGAALVVGGTNAINYVLGNGNDKRLSQLASSISDVRSDIQKSNSDIEKSISNINDNISRVGKTVSGIANSVSRTEATLGLIGSSISRLGQQLQDTNGSVYDLEQSSTELTDLNNRLNELIKANRSGK
jgi:septal ring factor EnvC (AmiA/AmiB activator)